MPSKESGPSGPVVQEAPAPARRRGWLYGAAALLALIGLTDALYLTAQHLAGRHVECSVVTGCAEVLGSAYATLGGIPIAAFGVAAYFGVFSLATLAAFGFRHAGRLFTLLVAAMGLGTLWLLYVQAFLLEAFCAYCLLSAAVTLLLCGIAVALRR